MCGRMTTHASVEQLVEALEVAEIAAGVEPLVPSYNVAPSQDIAVTTLRDDVRRLEKMRWGLVPFFSRDKKSSARMINARADSVRHKPAYRAAFTRRRCLIPVSGYYEWQKLAGRKQPWYFEALEEPVLVFAGLWESWRDPDDGARPLHSCTIVTTDANSDVDRLHDRMPLALTRDEQGAWLGGDADDAARLLTTPLTGRLHMFEVSTKVNNVGNDGPELIEPTRVTSEADGVDEFHHRGLG